MFKVKNLFLACLLFLVYSSLFAAPSSNLWPYWSQHSTASQEHIDFGAYQSFLDKYVIEENGQTYVRYAEVSQADKAVLDDIIKRYARINILEYNRNEQQAFWINLYNMLTIQAIIKNYPIKSILDIDKFWGVGPTRVWDNKVIKVDNKLLSLNDIEHRILRPVWKDPRIHSAVNCASLSCPNLSRKAYSGVNIDAQLDEAFSNWINSGKGVQVKDNKVYLSMVFDWYGSDFGDKARMLEFIKKYLKNKQTKSLLSPNSSIYFQKYNWGLNIYQS